jgi:hypothetical protein
MQINITTFMLKEYANSIGYELSNEDCVEIINTSYDGETPKQAVDDFLSAFER